ncbi:DUF983 domain-containing protein [Mucilaginibacter sp. KACC 22063]|uniref:DUF983 domain-containing protein n=1 Tax=Mucilaginibacter sp. KACC 22063 TaxID=3025666 RepID=UPI0023659F27|nr:DUF983 domain-containing protein [Mucilaginibacter sp. KACC 22063]WDF56298.1 DUF983 domain-containing protein [Mucilaginibacter sp. KACC 22063]
MAQTPQFKALVQGKCPRCRRGRMFVGQVYGIGTNKMNDSCPHCGFHFEIEPGYFYAAMYVSYALNVAESVTLGLATYILTGNTTSPWLYLIVILGGCFLLAPFNYRYSRIILLYWLSPKVHYQPHLDTDDSPTHS